MQTVDKKEAVVAKYGFMVKDLGIKTYCTEEALDEEE
jgi:hypothetical protein